MKIDNAGISLSQVLFAMITGSLLAAPAWAAELTYADNAYTKGDTLTADNLNTHFNEIKAGVNGNHRGIKTNNTGIKTNRASISTNSAAIDANGNKATANSTGVKTNRKKIAKSSADLKSLTDKVNARTTAAKPNAGDMQYWNGKAWVLVTAPKNTSIHSTLTFANGKPVWKANYYKIGDRGPAGGFVFYITNDGAHGLEAAPVDQSRGAIWGCYGRRINETDDKAVGTGAQNTAEIIAGCKQKRIAARIADAYSLNGYDDWFLPSQDELNEMWLKLADSDGDGKNEGPADPNNLAGFTINSYWSSSETGGNIAWVQAFYSGRQLGGVKNKIKTSKGHYKVRAIRAF